MMGRLGRHRRQLGASTYRLPDEVLLVRGGLCTTKTTLNALEVCEVQLGRPGLTVYGGEGLDLEATVRGAKLERYRMVRCTTAGQVRSLGFDIEKTLGPLHFTVWVPEGSETSVNTLLGAFSAVEPNPAFAPQDRDKRL